MKKIILLAVFFAGVAVASSAQLKFHPPVKTPDLKLNKKASTIFPEDMLSSTGYFFAVRGNFSPGPIVESVDSLYVISGEIGIGLTDWDEEIEMFGLYGSWSYSALPFVSLEYHTYLNAADYSVVSYKKIAPPVMIHAGVTGGTGVLFFFLPMGINGTAGLSSDFQDLFIRYGLSYDAFGFSIGYTGFINLTKNGPFPGYLSSPALEIRLFLY